MHKLKKWRIAVSLVFFAMFAWEFMWASWQHEYFTHTINALQFFPSLLEFTATFLAGGGSGFIIILILTLFFGRVYCSFLCPLGVLQDCAIRLKIQNPKSKIQNKYSRPLYGLHYAVTAIVLVTLALGIADILGALDPFANFGRIMTALVKPVYVFLNNAAVNILNATGIYSLKPRQMHHVSLSLFVFTSGFLAMIIVMSLAKGRFYCNTLCPVGGILSLAAQKAAYKIRIDPDKCTQCGLCEKQCKANCIDFKNAKVDFSRCVACYNCLGACKEGAVTYSKTKGVKAQDMGRREAIKTMAIAGVGAALLMLPGKLGADAGEGTAPVKSREPVLPPGAGSFKRFNSRCISCHLCVSSCPSKVLTGSTGFFQPGLDFSRSYCNYTCNTCSHVCPTGALLPLSIADKKITKIGEAKFVKQYCLVETNGEDCHICNEYCPTKACSLVPYKNGLRIPKIIESLCIGCGACENVCPARPKKALYIEGLEKHVKAEKPGSGQKRWRGGKEFPF